jgi:chromosome segregation ATPase
MTPEQEQDIRAFYFPESTLVAVERMAWYAGFEYGRVLLAEIDALRALYRGASEEVSSRGINLQETGRELAVAKERIAALEKELADLRAAPMVIERQLVDRLKASERRAERLREALTDLRDSLKEAGHTPESWMMRDIEAALADEPST